MNLFIPISFRKDKKQYKLFKLYTRKYYPVFEEVINGIFIPDYSTIDFDIIEELKKNNIPYILSDKTPETQKLQFAFFERLTLSGIAIFSKNKQYISKYIIYPILSIFKSTKEQGFYVHFPESSAQVKQLSFMFDVEFKAFSLPEDKLINLKTYIENQIMKRLRIKKIVR